MGPGDAFYTWGDAATAYEGRGPGEGLTCGKADTAIWRLSDEHKGVISALT